MSPYRNGDILALAKEVLDTEARAIHGLIPQLDERFTAAVELLFSCTGRVVVSGMGKSGIIGRKIAATFASTGTPATPTSARSASVMLVSTVTPMSSSRCGNGSSARRAASALASSTRNRLCCAGVLRGQ